MIKKGSNSPDMDVNAGIASYIILDAYSSGYVPVRICVAGWRSFDLDAFGLMKQEYVRETLHQKEGVTLDRLFTVPLGNRDKSVSDMYVRESHQGAVFSTNTYFGCFDCTAYANHTSIKKVRVCVKGSDNPHLIHVDQNGRETIVDISNDITVPIDQYNSGYLYVKCVEGGCPEEIWYEGDGEVKPVKLAIIICTYRREDMVRRNLEILMNTIQADPLLREDVTVICVDNGRTLTEVPDGVRLIPNPNYGGSGGYARGMMEAEVCTHFWLMDDDIAFEPTMFRRILTFLKYRKRESVRLAAGMFSFEQPTVQHEATASFDGYTFHSNCFGLDFVDSGVLLKNGIPENSKHQYGGWWSIVVPNTGDLPMPFFIKLDDVEYGLRSTDYAIMNGFGVWHEAFGKKGNAWSEYYTTRNTLILQSMYPDLGHSAVKMMSVRLLKALAYGEPKCMEAALKGVEDYLVGAEAFSAIDPEEKHREIMRAYGARLAEDMIRGKMLKAAARNLIKCRGCIAKYLKALHLLYRAKGPDRAWTKMTSKDFWVRYLKLTD